MGFVICVDLRGKVGESLYRVIQTKSVCFINLCVPLLRSDLSVAFRAVTAVHLFGLRYQLDVAPITIIVNDLTLTPSVLMCSYWC